MNPLLISLIFSIFALSTLQAETHDMLLGPSLTSYSPYERPENISEDLWNELYHYFVPENSREKAALDDIFTKKRATSSKKAMKKSEFLLISPSNKIVVARHRKLRGYLVKTYLDTLAIDDWYWWKRRINGANVIREGITRHGYENIFKVPRKWMYPLPNYPKAKSTQNPRQFILLVEDVYPLTQPKNRKAYKKEMTTERLKAFYTLMKELLLIDSVYPDNTPVCKDGKMAFLDTEHALVSDRPVPFDTVAYFLSDEMKAYWYQIVHHGFND